MNSLEQCNTNINKSATFKSHLKVGVVLFCFLFQACDTPGFQSKPVSSTTNQSSNNDSHSEQSESTYSKRVPQPLVTIDAIADANIDGVHWTITGPTSVAIDWRGEDNRIRYGTTSGNYTHQAFGYPPTPLPFSSDGPFLEAAISGLQPNTLYYYTIGTSGELTFRTPPNKGTSDFWFSQLADIGNSEKYSSVIPMQIQVAEDHPNIPGDDRPNFVIVPGDLTYSDISGVQSQIDTHFNDVMQWSLYAAYMPIWGNHEYRDFKDDLLNYKGRFAFPNAQASYGAPGGDEHGEDWYWFDYGNVRFIAIPEPYGDAVADWRSEVESIMKQAQFSSNIDFIITYGHRPAYSTGSHPTFGSRSAGKFADKLESLRGLFTKYRLHFNGHSHCYERTCPIVKTDGKVKCVDTGEGLVFITGGAGGKAVGSMAKEQSWTKKRAKHLHHIKVHVTKQKLEAFVICGKKLSDDDRSCKSGEIMDSWQLTAQ